MGNTSYLRLGVDARAARAGATMFTSATSRIKRGAGSVIRALNPLHMSLGKLGTYASIGSLAYGVNKAVRSYATFEKQLATVSTMLNKTTMHYLPKYERGLRSLSKKYGESTDTLSKGLYDVLSASIDTSKAMGVLEISVQAAKAGLTDTGVAADAITTILNSYGMSADQAARVSDILFATVKRGKTTFPELAGGIGQVASVAATAGLSLEEVGAALATMTRAGIKTDMAITSLKNIITTFLNPTDDARKAAKELGIELSSATLQADGLTGVLDRLKGATAEQLSAMMPNIRGFVGFAASIKQAEGQTKDLQLMMNSAGSTLEAFGKMSAIADTKFSRLKQSFVDTSRIVGKAFMDDALAGVKALNLWLDKNEAKIEYWADIASIEFTRLRKGVVAFAEYMQKDFSGAMNVAWDSFLVGLETASRAAMNLAIRTGRGIWKGVKEGIFGGKDLEAESTALQRYQQEGRPWEVQRKRGLLSLSLSNTMKVPADKDRYEVIFEDEKKKARDKTVDSFLAGFDQDLERYKGQLGAKLQSIKEGAATNSEAGKTFTDKLRKIDTDAYTQKLSAKWKFAFSEIKQAAQPIIETYNTLINRAKTFFGVSDSVKVSSQSKSDITNKPVLTKEMKDARADIDSMFNELREERKLVGLTNDERERAIQLTKFQSIAKQAYAEDVTKAAEIEHKYMEEFKQFQIARKLQENKEKALQANEDVDNALNILREEVKLIGLTNDERERAIELTKFQSLVKQAYAEDAVTAAKKEKEFMDLLEEGKKARELQEIADGIGDSFSRAFSDMVLGAKSAGEAIRALAQDVARMVMQQVITRPLANAISSFAMNSFPTKSAMGNVFNQGALVPMAHGDVVGSPTYFPMSGGRTGLMGEAGPEAVMPLTRTPDGRLGVTSSGSNGSNIEVVVNVVNESGRPMEAKQGRTKFDGKQLITEVVLDDIHGYGPIRNAIQGIG